MSFATKTVILAAGKGTRMQASWPGVVLEPAQAAMADRGVKAMIPVAGQPFLNYLLTSIADAGYKEVCLVVGHAQRVIRDYYSTTAPPARVSLTFAVQRAPRGTADAVLAAESFVDGMPFLMVNADNYYPPPVLATLRSVDEPGLIGFTPEGLVRGGNISPTRLQAYALVHVGPDGYLERIVEKPEPHALTARGRDVLVSMNCWQFSPRIFEASRMIAPSARHELELATAVQYAIDVLGERFRVVRSEAAVLDLSNRGDVGPVTAALRQMAVRF